MHGQHIQVQTVVAVSLVMLAVAAIAPTASARAHRMHATRPDARTMVLQLTDLPLGFGLDQGAYVSNAELTKHGDSTKDYGKLGRVTGYNVSYRRPGLTGVLGVNAFASIYRSTSGAHDSFLLTVAGAQRNGGPSFRWLPIAAPLGSETRAYLVTTTQSGTKVVFYTVAWRHGRIFAEVVGGGVSGNIRPAQVLALARKQDARIATAVT
jgi:hypothetical protein